ncbi:IQ motif and SEC7 domain containing protein 1 [Echinococcus multilocularis]|uniref:IQ motif and SEC7 domain containing protein 1 n=1 Tax=Echinococcus multilocularis TaxID=6211 RepID=A0A068YG72_ECHMU|nr:IQ motif and SEC7 domain containing protein 1 [Echinococcus multilocularis]
MHTNRSTLGSTRALSLSTEHMNKEPSLIAIPPPMSNLPYDPPHLSRWQQAPQRFQGSNNSRSGSAVAPRIDVLQQHQSTSKSVTLNDQFRALTLHPRNHCDPHRTSTIRPGIINATTYELSDDLRAKEVDLMERCYGGRLRAQRAARIIQRKYREYRMRAQYAQLRSDRRLTNQLTNGLNSYYPEDQREVQHLASMEDLVIDRAYLDWASEAAGSPGGGSIPDLTVEAKGSRSSAPSGATQSPESGEVSSHSCSNLISPKGQHPPQSSSPGTGTGSTSGFVSSPGSCSSGSLPTESVTPNTQVTRQSLEHQTQQPLVYYVMDKGEEQRAHHQAQQLYVAIPVRSDQQYINLAPQHQQPQQQQQQRYLTQPATATAVLVRRCSTGSNSVQAPVWCTPDGKMYTLAYTDQAATTLVVSPPSRQPIVVAPIRREGNCGGLGNSPVLVQLHHHSTSASAGVASATNLVPVCPRTPVTSAAVADRCRKRLYRVCLNYFNKSPVKGMDMLIRFRFLEASPRQIARFLHIRRGLARTAIGEYLGEMKHDLCVATARQFIRQVDFREKEIDEALRLMMSLFRTPGESQKIVHLMTAFQLAYVEQNSARVKAQFRNPESVMILAYAIIMLHTDMYSPNVRPGSKMTREDFVNNLRGIDDGEDLDRNLLLAIFDRMQAGEMLVAPDHTDQVRRVHRLLTGPLRPANLVLPQRRLVCYCRLYEVPDKTKRDRSGPHQRDVFLFNDLLLVTKAIRKRRKESSSSTASTATYQVRACITLLGIRVTTFETTHYENGFSLYHVDRSSAALDSEDDEKKKSSASSSSSTSAKRTSSLKSTSEPSRGNPVISFNAKTQSDKLRLLEDIQECITETLEMDRIRLDDVLCKQAPIVKPLDAVAAITYGLPQGTVAVAPMLHSRHTRGGCYLSHLSPDTTSLGLLASARSAGVCVPGYRNHQHQQNHHAPALQRPRAYVYRSHEQSH